MVITMSSVSFLMLVLKVSSAPVTNKSVMDVEELGSHHVILNESWFDYNCTDNSRDYNRITAEDASHVKPLQDELLFEGDLRISYKQYKEYYLDEEKTTKDNTVAQNNGRKKRAVKSGSSILWPSGNVYYTFDSSVNTIVQYFIRKAMDYMENKTCLRFINTSVTSSKLKITFTTMDSGCYINRIGRGTEQGQIINLGRGCVTQQIILHEIGHAIGFWHEQSRPDRDDYVEILWDNIIPGREFNFQKMPQSKVNYYDTKYDYHSIMHYFNTAWSHHDCSGESCITIGVKNQAEYESQGKPRFGLGKELSFVDILQIHRMYAVECGTRAMGGLKGVLNVTIIAGVNLPETDSFLAGKPEPYVKLSARYPGGYKELTTSVESGTQVSWNQKLSFGGKEWLYFKMQVWDRDPLHKKDDEMTQSQTVYLEEGTHLFLKHCGNHECTTYISYEYSLKVDYVDDCLNVSCLNGGTCLDGVFTYTCNCTENYEGDHCQYEKGNLRFYARYGWNLPDYDGGWFGGESDPYVKVIAYDNHDRTVTKTTSRKKNTSKPTWNQWLSFGTRAWKKIKVRVYDKDINSDDALSSQKSYNIERVYYISQVMNCYEGYIVFAYSYN